MSKLPLRLIHPPHLIFCLLFLFERIVVVSACKANEHELLLNCLASISAVTLKHQIKLCINVQGDHSACSKPAVDIYLKVVFYYTDLIVKRNFQINVNLRF